MDAYLERLSVNHSHAVSVSAPDELFKDDGNAADGMVIGTRGNHYFAIFSLAELLRLGVSMENCHTTIS